MQDNSRKTDLQKKRKEIYRGVAGAFEQKYGWLGRQAAREMLMSVASWNIEKYSDPDLRYRTHIMLAWERGWIKSSLMTKMAKILGDDLCSVMGKVTDASLRGSVSSGRFTPPKPLKTPFVISTEFGQTNFEDELLNMFHTMLEEGYTNISMNKIANLTDGQRKNIEKKYNNEIQFGDENEFNLNTDFVFWGATYDPAQLDDDALRSRFNVVTPMKPLDGGLVEAADKSVFNVNSQTVRNLREEVKRGEPVGTDFTPPSSIYSEYNPNFRESRDLQSYMACRNWWGLDVNPEIMADYIEHLQKSRRRANMNSDEFILDIIFDNPLSYDEIMDRTGYTKIKVYKILNRIGAKKIPDEDHYEYVVYSGDKIERDDKNDEEEFLDSLT